MRRIALTLTAVALILASPAQANLAVYVLPHPAHEHCRKHYSRHVVRARGHAVTLCVYSPPVERPAAPAARPPSSTAPVTPPAAPAAPTPPTAPKEPEADELLSPQEQSEFEAWLEAEQLETERKIREGLG